MRIAGKLLVAVGFCASSLTAEGALAPSMELARSIAEHVEAAPTACPDEIESFGAAGIAVCGRVDAEFKVLKKTLKAFLEERPEVVELTGTRWRREGDYRARRFFVDREMFTILFHPEQRTLALLPSRTCFDEQTLARWQPRVAIAEGIATPTIALRAGVDYPEEARAARTAGIVVLQAIIGKAGTIEDSCLVYVLPERMGFEAAALASVKQWRYEPARQGGVPINLLINLPVTWERD